VRADRIGLWGGSYGGYLTALGLARASDLFAAGVDFHGVHDWNTTIPNFAERYDPAARAEVARLAFESSPMAAVKGWRSPVLLIHGDDDRNVPFGETINLVAAQGAERLGRAVHLPGRDPRLPPPRELGRGLLRGGGVPLAPAGRRRLRVALPHGLIAVFSTDRLCAAARRLEAKLH